MLAHLLTAFAMLYLLFGTVVASLYVLFDVGTRGGTGGMAGPMDLARWFGITLGWLPALIYFVTKFLWNIFGPNPRGESV